ncbi:MAG: DNA-binding protein [Planctomycetes bacterium]|nr:DNA-binding protein [Planctomycetota bacterium]
MQYANGTIKRVVAIRMAPGEDVLAGLQRACDENNIRHGMVLSGIGSLNGARFFDPIPLPDKKAGYGYGDAIVLDGPIELVSLNGMICQGEDGKTMFHVHAGLSGPDGTSYGGHLIDGNRVLLTVDVILGELDNIDMGRRFDPDLDVFIFDPKQAPAK